MEEAVIEHINGIPVIRIGPAVMGNSRPPVREKRPIWSQDEIIKMLQIMKDRNIISLLYGGKYRRSDVFKVVAANLRKMGYIRTSEQISTKWKHLRLTYAHAKAETKPEAKQECPFYEQMDDLLGDKLHIVGVDIPEETKPTKEEIETIEFENIEKTETAIENEEHMEISETDYNELDFSQVEVIHTDVIETDQVDFSQVEVIQTDLSETDCNQVDFSHVEVIHTDPNEIDANIPGPSGQEEVMVEMQEPQQDESEFGHDVDSEATVVDTSPPKKARKRKMFRNPPGRLRKSNEGTYSNALRSFTKEWELMMIRVAEKEREQDRLDREREKNEQRLWEEQLIAAQSEAMRRANSQFLTGLRGLFDSFKKSKLTSSDSQSS